MVEPGGLYYTEEGELNREALNLALQMYAGGLAIFQLLEALLIRTVQVTTPAAGAEWTATVTAGSTWEILSVHDTLTTSAVVANRAARLRLLSGGIEVQHIPPVAVQAAGVAITRSYVAGAGATTAVDSREVIPLGSPPTILQATDTVSSQTTNLDAGDAYSAIVLVVREWAPGRVARYLRYLFADLDASGGIL